MNECSECNSPDTVIEVEGIAWCEHCLTETAQAFGINIADVLPTRHAA